MLHRVLRHLLSKKFPALKNEAFMKELPDQFYILNGNVEHTFVEMERILAG